MTIGILLAVGAALIGGLGTVVLLWRVPSGGLWLIGLMVLLTASGVSTLPDGEQVPIVVLMNINIYSLDLVAMVLGVVWAARICSSPHTLTNASHAILIAQLLLILYSTSIGASRFGLKAAGNNAREALYFVVIAGYAATTPRNFPFLLELGRVMRATAISLLVLVSVRWALLASGMLPLQLYRSVTGEPIRVISAAAAMALAEAVIIGISCRRASKRPPFGVTELVALAAVILLQHRTVWLVVLVTTAFLLCREKEIRSAFARNLLLCAAGLVFICWSLLSSSASAGLMTGISVSASDTATLQWRITGWRELLAPDRYSGAGELLFGHPYGTGYLRGAGDTRTNVMAHDQYVQTFYDLGISGTLLLLVQYPLLWWSLAARASRGVLVGRLAQTPLLMLAVYYITYSQDFHQGVLFGFAIWCSRQSRKTNQKQRPNVSLGPATCAAPENRARQRALSSMACRSVGSLVQSGADGPRD